MPREAKLLFEVFRVQDHDRIAVPAHGELPTVWTERPAKDAVGEGTSKRTDDLDLLYIPEFDEIMPSAAASEQPAVWAEQGELPPLASRKGDSAQGPASCRRVPAS